ncbi:MAG: hypothetical protein CM1200mP27_08530 [Chloroflexota bacterium]|nr:MAG: hypothetical protein CM1200mP27_08530 [Chloroflexota bacterium]
MVTYMLPIGEMRGSRPFDPPGEFIEKLRGNGTISKWAQNFLNINVEEASAREKADLNLQIDYFDDSPHEESSQ